MQLALLHDSARSLPSGREGTNPTWQQGQPLAVGADKEPKSAQQLEPPGGFPSGPQRWSEASEIRYQSWQSPSLILRGCSVTPTHRPQVAPQTTCLPLRARPLSSAWPQTKAASPCSCLPASWSAPLDLGPPHCPSGPRAGNALATDGAVARSESWL